MTINTIIKEMKGIPADRLEEVYQFVHTLAPKYTTSASKRKKILSFSGAFRDMKKSEYNDFVKTIKKTREELFTRHIDV
jgi:hypothetical protein